MKYDKSIQETSVLKLKIGGMNCSRCVSRVEQAVGNLAGIEAVSVSIIADEAVVVYNTYLTSQSDIVNSIQRLGYSAMPIS
ncbi:MAG: heavy-metal-associated domain-containing protein [Candidatus Heimdallarchaeota archaeon]